MLEHRKNSESLCQTAKESSKFNEDVLHEISNIAVDLAQLTVPCVSGIVRGTETTPDHYNMEVLDSRSVRSIESMCTKLSDRRLSPMERDELTDGLRTVLIRQVSWLESKRLAIDSPVERSVLDDAIATLGHLALAMNINEMKLLSANPSPTLFREPYELGGKFLHVNTVLHSLPSEARAITEALLVRGIDVGNTPKAVSEGVEALRDTMKDYKLNYEQELQVLKCLALASDSLEVRNFAIKEYFRTLNPADHDETRQKILSVQEKGVAPSLFLPHFLEHLSEQVTRNS